MNQQIQEAYFKKLLRVCQKHKELMHKDAGQLFDIACDMESGKLRRNHKFFKYITNERN